MAKRSRQPKGPDDRRDRPLERLRQFEAQRGIDSRTGPAPESVPDTQGDNRRDDASTAVAPDETPDAASPGGVPEHDVNPGSEGAAG